ncbi:MAG: hypothetical protein B1H11_03370 [Desulfobacteraceae bacterium 4484_190.1]|nr:MAG: hypothetical protein B1H11_03370 [Desulfobacteraceae bacterium 4484_190.1]
MHLPAAGRSSANSTLAGFRYQYTESKFVAFQYMLSLRLERRRSIRATSTIMNRFQICPDYIGSISQYLTYFGSSLSDTVSSNNNETKIVVFLSDDIFSKNTPIIITVDAYSSAILIIELTSSRKAEE